MAGRAIRPITRVEMNALTIFASAIWAANSVDPWADDSDGTPYFYAARAFESALVELYGPHIAEAIRELCADNGETPEYNLWKAFGAEVGG